MNRRLGLLKSPSHYYCYITLYVPKFPQPLKGLAPSFLDFQVHAEQKFIICDTATGPKSFLNCDNPATRKAGN